MGKTQTHLCKTSCQLYVEKVSVPRHGPCPVSGTELELYGSKNLNTSHSFPQSHNRAKPQMQMAFSRWSSADLWEASGRRAN